MEKEDLKNPFSPIDLPRALQPSTVRMIMRCEWGGNVADHNTT